MLLARRPWGTLYILHTNYPYRRRGLCSFVSLSKLDPHATRVFALEDPSISLSACWVVYNARLFREVDEFPQSCGEREWEKGRETERERKGHCSCARVTSSRWSCQKSNGREMWLDIVSSLEKEGKTYRNPINGTISRKVIIPRSEYRVNIALIIIIFFCYIIFFC